LSLATEVRAALAAQIHLHDMYAADAPHANGRYAIALSIAEQKADL
jgi:hypothetical protein